MVEAIGSTATETLKEPKLFGEMYQMASTVTVAILTAFELMRCTVRLEGF